MRKSIKPIVMSVLLVSAILAGIFYRSGQQKQLVKDTRMALYTTVTITVLSPSQKVARQAIDAAYQELAAVGRLLNFYAEDSELSLINQNAGIQAVKVTKDTLEIIKAAILVAEATEGGFDVTIGPLVKLWDFNKKVLPTIGEIEALLPNIGYKNIQIDTAASTVFIEKSGVKIDLGGIIKGFAADKAVEVLRKNGIEDGIVAVAGDIKTFGRQVDGRPWHVGIQNPRQEGENDQLLATVDLENHGISTSGDYQRFFIANGKRYHHLLDPQTGFPADLCQSVTVIAKSATMSDSLATGIFILGPEKGMAALKKLGMDGVIVDQNGKVLLTEGIKNAVHFIGKE